jgi:hypothetical protein
MSDDVKLYTREELEAFVGQWSIIDQAAMEPILRLVATARAGLEAVQPVTATEIEREALAYDREYRGGIGRGDIDLELAERLAAWFNKRITRSGQRRNDGGEHG